MYSKKRYIIVAIIVLITVLGILVMQKIYKDRLEEKDSHIATLQDEIDRLGEMVFVYRTVVDVKAGNESNDYELEPVQIPLTSVNGNVIKNPKDVTGRYYKVNLSAGTILSEDMFIDYELEDDMRYMDVVFDEIPIGLEAGDYIDVRISFPLGQDYIALSHKRVAEINGQTVKLIVGQKDFFNYESMKTDIATYRSTKIYGAVYVEAGIQEAATTYYPINLDVLLTMLKDPNVNTGDYSQTMVLREQLEEQLSSSEKVDISNTVTSGRLSISEKFSVAQEQYKKLQIQKERDTQQAAKRAEKSKSENNVEVVD